MNETIKTLTTRRSVRSYKDTQIPDEVLKEILTAGEYAPSGKNRMPTVMVVVKDKETIAMLSKLNAQIMGNDIDPFYGAPTVVIVFSDSTVNTYLEDGSLVMGNLMNAAASLGVASCWIHRARETFQTDEGKVLMKKWGLDEKYVGIGNCILGYAEGEIRQPIPRKDGFVIYD
ncbi:MAG: nitroreductase [Oscillospiraceae bacterium]